MESQRARIKNYFAIFIPSSIGIVLYVFLSGLGIVLNQFDIIKTYLQLPANLHLTRIVAGWASTALTTVIGESRTETLVVGCFWAFVGLIVYMFLRGLARIATEFDDDLSERGYVWPRGENRMQPLKDLTEQAAFRLAAIIGLLIVVFLPLAAVLRGPILVDFLGPSKVLQYVTWFLASLLIWHVLVVLLRLTVLRARLLG